MTEEAAELLRQTNFGALDWVIVFAYLSISLVIGLCVREYARSMSAYVTAGRSLGLCLGIATMTGTELGLVTVMYSAQKGFTGGFSAFHIALVAGVVTFFVGLTGFIVADLRRYRVLTIPEFYQLRYGRGVRVAGGVMLALGGILNMGLFLKVGSMFLVGITGMSSNGWALPVVMTSLLAMVLVYTVLGGMISVVITDYIQFVVLSVGLVVTTLLALWRLGWANIFDTVLAVQGEKGFNPLVAEGEFGPEYVTWMVCMGLVSCAVWPTAVARALAMESPLAVRRQYMWSSISFTIRFLIPYFWGICAFVFLVNEAPQLMELIDLDGSKNKAGANLLPNLYAMPIFLGRILPTGLIGIISAAMIAAFMSTHDSYLLCWSSVITQDIVAPLRKEPLNSAARIRLTRALIVVIGLYILAWGLFYEGSDDVWDYMAVTGAVYFTGAIPLLVGGLYWSKASSAGAIGALVTGSTAVLGLGPVKNLMGEGVAWLSEDLHRWFPLEEYSSARYGLFSMALTAIVFVVLSLLIPDRNRPPLAPPPADDRDDAKRRDSTGGEA